MPALGDRAPVVGEAQRALARAARPSRSAARPRRPRVIAGRKPTGMRASRAAASRSERSSGAESSTGSVLGIAITAPNPPAAAARVPRLEVLLVLLAGRAQVHVRVKERRQQTQRARALDQLLASGLAASVAGAAELGDHAVAHAARRGARRAPRADRARGRRAAAARPVRCGPWTSGVRGHQLARAAASRASCRRAARAAPASSSYSTAMRTTTPASTWAVMTRLRRVDDLAGELHAAVDRAGVHQHLARAQAARR